MNAVSQTSTALLEHREPCQSDTSHCTQSCSVYYSNSTSTTFEMNIQVDLQYFIIAALSNVIVTVTLIVI